MNVCLLEGWILGGFSELFRFLNLLIYVWLDWWVYGMRNSRGITHFLFCLWTACYHNTRYKCLRRVRLVMFLYCHWLTVRHLVCILFLRDLTNFFDFFFLDNLCCEIRCVSLFTCRQLWKRLLFLQKYVRKRINLISNLLLLLLLILLFLRSERVVWDRCKRAQMLFHIIVSSQTLRLWRDHAMFKRDHPIRARFSSMVAVIYELGLGD
jgi:hypothetical protein